MSRLDSPNSLRGRATTLPAGAGAEQCWQGFGLEISYENLHRKVSLNSTSNVIGLQRISLLAWYRPRTSERWLPDLLAVQYFGAIERPDSGRETCFSMARYSAFLGRRVEVQYRAGDILLPASGTLVADSGRSIFLEQHLQQHGQMKQFRWEIPYQYIVRLEQRSDPPADSGAGNAPFDAPLKTPGLRTLHKKPANKPPMPPEPEVRSASDDPGASDPQSMLSLRPGPKPA
jgi:hypothetical protein